jgi:tetratricopeptide (TPR) repeat protein
MFGIKKLSTYLKDLPSDTGPRRNMRLPVKLPMLYSFAVKDRKEKLRECLVTNISRDGIAVELKDVYPAAVRRSIKKNNRVLLKLELPGRKKPLDLTGGICWFKSPNPRRVPAVYDIGLRFEDTSLDDKVDILEYGLFLVRRKQLLTAGLVLAGIFFLGMMVWVVESQFTESRIKKNLIMTQLKNEALRSQNKKAQKLIDELQKLVDRKLQKIEQLDTVLSEQTSELESKKTEIRQQRDAIGEQNSAIDLKNRTISQLDGAINELTSSIKKREAYLETVQKIIDEIGEASDMTSTSRIVILDNNYFLGREAFKKKKYEEAAAYYRVLTQKYPDSSLALRLLFRAYSFSGQKDQAEILFAKYMKKVRKEITSVRKEE